MKKEKLIKRIEQGIHILNEEVDMIEYMIKTEKDPLFKKSLINRRLYLINELKIGNEYLKNNK
jgi:hypothetical protein